MYILYHINKMSKGILKIKYEIVINLIDIPLYILININIQIILDIFYLINNLNNVYYRNKNL